MMIASRLSGLPEAAELPTMMFLPQDQMCVAVEMCGGGARVLGHYDMERRILTLPRTWSSLDVYSLGSLLHEMVHHLQAERWPTGDEDRPCDGEVEKVAYAVEHRFYEMMKVSPDIDPIWLLILTTCHD